MIDLYVYKRAPGLKNNFRHFERQHFPGDYMDDLYVYQIREARRMRSDRELIKSPKFVLC